MAAMKPIRVVFVNGPFHRFVMEMTVIPEVDIVVDGRQRCIYAYVREETTYYYDADLSRRLTEQFDTVRGKFKRVNVLPICTLKPGQSLDTVA
jgi:hypothetical protein